MSRELTEQGGTRMNDSPEQLTTLSKGDTHLTPAPPAEASRVSRFGKRLVEMPGNFAVLLVRVYQYLISPLLGKTCRFYPSCSQYFILSVRKFGLAKALWKGTNRICRCHPWNPGGYDPP